MTRWRSLLLTLLILTFGAGVMPAHAQNPGAQRRDTPAAQQSGDQQPLASKHTAQIRALMAQKLAVDVDPATLFVLPLAGEGAERTRIVLTLLDDRRALARAVANPASLSGLDADEAKLAIAQAEFLSLPLERRKALLEAHADRVASVRADKDARAKAAARLESLQRVAANLENFLAEKPSDPALLSLSALDLDTPVTASARRALILSPRDGADAPAFASDDKPLEARIEAAERRVDWLRGRILNLPRDRRAALIAVAERSGGAALAQANAAEQEAQEAAAAAAAAAREASSELQRLVQSERARLLKVKAAQAAFSARTAREQAKPAQITDMALGWRRKVRELLARPAFDDMRTGDADRLYWQIVSVLKDVRGRLDTALSMNPSEGTAELTPPVIDAELRRGNNADTELSALRDDLVASAARLVTARRNQAMEERAALREAMITMNEARLTLIPALSPKTRTSILGFGDEGIAQAGRELDQISLDLRYNAGILPQHLGAAIRPFLQPTPGFVFELVRLVILILLFRWWRGAGGKILARLETDELACKPCNFLSAAKANIFHYLQAVRRPLDWLLFVLLVRWLLPSDLVIPGIGYLWLALIWVLAAALSIRFVDALASGHRKEDPRAALRWRSLRLIAGVALVVGLILSLTSESVGRGAIHNWVLSACWLIVPPIILLLAHWWRDRIAMLAEAGSDRSALLAWSAHNPNGPVGVIARVAAGGALLLQGLRSIITRRINDIALVREIFDQRARARAARQAADDEASGRYRHLADAQLEALDPHRLPLRQVDAPAEMTGGTAPGTLTLVTGLRGMGKTTVLEVMARQAGKEALLLRVGEGGEERLMLELGEAAGLSRRARNPETSIVSALKSREALLTICIDDVQRLIIPSIGGLAAFDRLLALARACEGSVCWIFGMGDPAWNYVSRARNDRLLFDTIVRLPRWDNTTLRALIERRTEQADFDPDFSQYDETSDYRLYGDIAPEERRRLAYFDALTDYSGGNPSVALEFWRRSLYADNETGRVVVRTFAAPNPAKLGALPPAAMFVLRAILQMDIGYSRAIEASTDLSPIVVADALRGLSRLGVIVPAGDGHRITLYWLREVVRLLERQNLIAGNA